MSFDLQPGEHVTLLTSPASVDQVGFAARRSGLEVRDCFSVQTPSGSLMALLVRMPFGNTVVTQMVKHGVGVVGIDQCRLSVHKNDPNKRQPALRDKSKALGRFESGLVAGYRAATLTQGRFPSNLLLVHGPDCECVGTKRVKGTNPIGPNPGTGGKATYEGGWSGSSNHDYTSNDGTEEVTAWDCQPDCPVRLLDQQSGVTTSAKSKTFHSEYGGKSHTGFMRGWSDPDSQYEDTGGASRFFYQATNLDDLESYLRTFTRHD